VMFRATSVGDACKIWTGMLGLDGVYPAGIPGYGWPVLAVICLGFLVIFFAPNTQQIMGRFDPAYNWKEWRAIGRPPIRWTWKPNLLGLTLAGVALFLGVVFIDRGRAVFLYFNF